MRTSLDCLPCLLRQTVYAAGIASGSKKLQKEIVYRIALLLPELDFEISPPENAILVYNLISEMSGNIDPFEQIKKQSNELALNLRPRVLEKIKTSSDPFQTAVKFSMAGNIIDYGAHHEFDVHETIDKCLTIEPAINHFDQLVRDIEKAETILYLADNSGEIVFDELLIRLIRNKRIILAVKEGPILNDALIKDAVECGLDKYCKVISNGTNCPGTPLQICNADFQKIFRNADLIISKGQGNFETLSDVKAPIYFLLTVKCLIVGEYICKLAGAKSRSVKYGDMVLMKNF